MSPCNCAGSPEPLFLNNAISDHHASCDNAAAKTRSSWQQCCCSKKRSVNKTGKAGCNFTAAKSGKVSSNFAACTNIAAGTTTVNPESFASGV